MNTPRLIIIVSVTLIFMIGILMVFNTTSAEVLDKASVDTNLALIKQVSYAVVGLLLGCFVNYLGYKNIIRLSPLFLLFCTFLLILVFVPKIGHEINGAKRWIGIGPFGFQPSELAKYLIPIYFIDHFTIKGHPKSFKEFVIFLLVFMVPIFLILIEPDNGTTIIIITSLIVMFFLCKFKLSYWAWPLAFIIAVGAVAAYHMPHVPDRIKIYLHPELDIRGKGHQPYQSKIAAGSGQLFGKGFGESMQKLNYLPEARSDYIAAIFAEEFGFIGILFLMCLYLTITFSGFYIAAKAPDKQGFYLSAILTFLISFQAFLNLGVVSGLLPSKGTTLPFFSQGGTSLLANIAAIFLILNIASSVKEKAYSK